MACSSFMIEENMFMLDVTSDLLLRIAPDMVDDASSSASAGKMSFFIEVNVCIRIILEFQRPKLVNYYNTQHRNYFKKR